MGEPQVENRELSHRVQRGREGVQAWGSKPLQTLWTGSWGYRAKRPPASPRPSFPLQTLLRASILPRSLSSSQGPLHCPVSLPLLDIPTPQSLPRSSSHSPTGPPALPRPLFFFSGLTGPDSTSLPQGRAGYLVLPSLRSAQPGWEEVSCRAFSCFFSFYAFPFFCFLGRTSIGAFALRCLPSGPDYPQPLSSPSLSPPPSNLAVESLQNDSHSSPSPLQSSQAPGTTTPATSPSFWPLGSC